MSAWEGSLTYLLNQIGPRMAAAIESRLRQELQLECRHLGLLNYMYDFGGTIRIDTASKPIRSTPSLDTTLEIMQLFREIFWGPQNDQQQPIAQIPALINHLEGGRLVRRLYLKAAGETVLHLLLTSKGKAIRRQAMLLVQQIEAEFLAPYSKALPRSLRHDLLELREGILVWESERELTPL